MSWLRVRAVVLRHLTELRHTPTRANDLFVWPFIDTLIFGSIGAFLAQGITGEINAAFVLSGLFLFHVVFQSSVALSVGFMSETADRNLLNLTATPLRASEYATGLVLFGLIKMCVGLTVVATLARVMFDYNVLNGGWPLIPFVVALIVVGIGLSFCLISLQLRFGRSAEQITWALAAFIPTISGAFVPITALPDVFEPVARLLPTTHAFQAVRALIAGEPLPVTDLLITVAGALVVLAIGVTAISLSLRSFRRQGLVGRYS